MNARGAALVVLIAAGALLGAVALPLRGRAAAEEQARRRAEELSESARTRLADLEKRVGALAAVDGRTDPGRLRRAVAASLDGTPVSQVKIDVQPARPPLSATVRLSAEGSFDDLVDLSGRLVQPGNGLILARFRLSPRVSALRLEMEAVGVGPAR